MYFFETSVRRLLYVFYTSMILQPIWRRLQNVTVAEMDTCPKRCNDVCIAQSIDADIETCSWRLYGVLITNNNTNKGLFFETSVRRLLYVVMLLQPIWRRFQNVTVAEIDTWSRRFDNVFITSLLTVLVTSWWCLHLITRFHDDVNKSPLCYY